MSSYNIDDIAESFEFVINGKKYEMRYPTPEEFEKQGDMSDEEASKLMMDFITPIDKDALPIDEVLKKVNFKKLQRFNEMIRTEFLGEHQSPEST